VYGNKFKMFTTFVYILYIKISLERTTCDYVFSVSVYQLQPVFNKELKINRSSLKKIW